MSSENTVSLIAETFVALANEMPLEKISVSDIVARSHKNRKTFYYHFADKSALVHWIFRNDLAKLLSERFDESQLVYNREQDDSLHALPYYVMVKTGVRSLDGEPFMQALAACMENRRRFFAKALRMTDTGNLRAYLYDLYVPAVRNDVRFILSNRYLNEESVNFLSEYFAGAMIDWLVRRTCGNPSTPIMAGVEPFGNILHLSLEAAIKEQQMRRTL